MAMNDIQGAPIGYEDAFTLSAAREAVLAAIETARASGALADEVGIAELTGQAGEIGDVYALHRLVELTPALDQQLCRFPGCFHPRRPAEKTKPFVYCAHVRDAQGRQKHTPTRSMRLRNWLEAGALPQAEPVEDDPGGVRPVSLARMSIPDQIARVEQAAEQVATQLTSAMNELRKQVALVGDDEARAAEIESVRYDEGKKADEAKGAQLAAERDARKARQGADAAEQARLEAVEAAEEANARADRAEQNAAEQAERDAQAVTNAQDAAELARAEAVTAIAEADTRIQQATADADERVAAAQSAADARIEEAENTAQQRIEAAETDAQERIRAAEQRAEQEIARIREEADTAVTAAQDEAQTAQSAAETATNQMRAAQDDAAEARRASARDEAAAKAAREELVRVRDERDRLQQRLDDAEGRHRTELDAANTRLDALQSRLDDSQRLHQDELRRLATERATERAQDEARAATQLESIQSAHTAQVESLHERISLMQNELNRARSAETPPEASESDDL
ncbi:hypothetical protein [Nocardia sp. CA-120079]|uniref:hypothetical protein n=1 Tax=Nocardia sp. CA-120079 TaxID=3239974 RepID=UPI003D974601